MSTLRVGFIVHDVGVLRGTMVNESRALVRRAGMEFRTTVAESEVAP